MLERKEALLLDAPVRRVMLLEDRAQVTRDGALRLAAGSHRLRVTAVAPVLVDKSLVARSASQGVRIDEARVVRRWKFPERVAPASHDGERQRLRDERERKTEDRRLADHRRELTREAATLL